MILIVGFLLSIFILNIFMLNTIRKINYKESFNSYLDIVKGTELKIHNDIIETQKILRSDFLDSIRSLQIELKDSHDKLKDSLTRDSFNNRAELASSLSSFSSGFSDKLKGLIEINDRRLLEIRNTLENRLDVLQTNNASKLDEMRCMVEEKLHATLEQRLGESFKIVSERLEAVHKGLGEMQTLAVGVGDLKRVLSNVKSRGTWGEVQLARLIEDVMTDDQYGKNVKLIPNSDSIVEFAIKLPGRRDDNGPVWLPIDSKFPKEEYDRLMEANDAGNIELSKAASSALAKAIELQAKMISSKYISPPYTTEFAIMFLPTEGLYAEVMRYPGLFDKLHNLRITVTGPSNLSALLNSLQIGFRTIAIEKRSSEVWNILRVVKTEFFKFGESLASVKKTLDNASNKLGQTEVRSRVMLRNLKSLEVLPEQELEKLLLEDE
ncbi:DNA recombination protein RmuC [Candidatus Kinetoplastidibacterium crithidiae]|uniref:DNA recombination protein RmuC n=1 Tax=Candidatus Kinetoplastidibacterium crithidiae TCC036E TaxID=1208918 RepID=M1L416_9PROT|nr:DNA recombination protein RmuC [Candidatus Kinetoplastibacterium crithidii]AFZ82473.1 DNA recombination protein RmuC [Candidatus Kinetoplastibacterium crithidii (ex Angomonas deanei ATCC 30255)]AGF47483.1 DNA recombination protein RmuC [Candidatus Kinetoplastibacterium crithidii TCC036E]